MIFRPDPHQKRITVHCLVNELAMVHAGMGLGKTSAVLQALEDKILDTGSGVLVVAPIKVCLLTWPDEIKKWDQFRWMRVVSLRTKEGREAWRRGTADIYLINWEYLPSFIKNVMVDVTHRREMPVQTIVYDEISKAKSHKSKRVNAWRRFSYLFRHRIGLTGTPAPNSYLDLFAQYRLLMGNKSPLGTSFIKFRNRYFYPEDYMQYRWVIRDGAKEEIQKLIAPYTIALNAAQYLKIPPVHTIDREVKLPEEGLTFYRKLEKTLLAKIRDREIEALNAAVLVGKLQQVTSGFVYDKPEPPVYIHNEKIKALKQIIREHPGKPILVVTMFEEGERARLLKRIPGAELFDERRMKAWNRGEIPVWIIDPRSAGHGLNLQYGGHIIVWMSLTYSREFYDQTNARLARKGQEEETFIFRIVAPGTVDDAVASVLEAKGTQQQGLISALTNLQILSKAA